MLETRTELNDLVLAANNAVVVDQFFDDGFGYRDSRHRVLSSRDDSSQCEEYHSDSRDPNWAFRQLIEALDATASDDRICMCLSTFCLPFPHCVCFLLLETLRHAHTGELLSETIFEANTEARASKGGIFFIISLFDQIIF